MENKFSTLLHSQLTYLLPVIPYQSFLQRQKEEAPILDPDHLPLFINPAAKIDKNGIVRNASEFKELNDAFDFGRCLECQALCDEHYGSSGETPCMKCHALVQKIGERNAMRYHLLEEFRGTSLLH